jgi:hypothetical protein
LTFLLTPAEGRRFSDRLGVWPSVAHLVTLIWPSLHD